MRERERRREREMREREEALGELLCIHSANSQLSPLKDAELDLHRGTSPAALPSRRS